MKKLSPAAQAMGITIERFVIGHAYARSGNAHNPTEEVIWHVRCRNSLVGTAWTYRGALELAEMYAVDPC